MAQLIISNELKIYRCPNCDREELFTLTNLEKEFLFFHKRPDMGTVCDTEIKLAEIWTDREEWQIIIDQEGE